MIARKFQNTLIDKQFLEDFKGYTANEIHAMHYFLHYVKKANDMHHGLPSPIYFKNIDTIFRTYRLTSYHPYLEALEDKGYVNINWHYEIGFNIQGTFGGVKVNRHDLGQCRTFQVTPKGIDALISKNREYLNQIYSNKAVRRTIQKSISERKVMHEHYDDEFLDHQWDIMLNMTFLEKDMKDYCESFNDNKPLQETAYRMATDILTKNYNKLEYGDKNKRVPTINCLMPSTQRKLLRYKSKSYRGVIDGRLFYGSLFLPYLNKCINANIDIYSSYSFHSLHLASHETDRMKLQDELDMWLCLLLNHDNPKKAIGDVCGYTEDKIKHAINETINGKMTYYSFKRFMKEVFPMHWSYFIKLPKKVQKQIGCQLGLLYEAPLFQNPELYRLGEELGLTLAYENDGVGVFADASMSDHDLQSKMRIIVEWLEQQTMNLWGIKMVFKQDMFQPLIEKKTMEHFNKMNVDDIQKKMRMDQFNKEVDKLRTRQIKEMAEEQKLKSYKKKLHKQKNKSYWDNHHWIERTKEELLKLRQQLAPKWNKYNKESYNKPDD